MGQLIRSLKTGIAPLPSGTSFMNPVAWLATWFGSGRLRPAPGTMGTLAAIPFGYILMIFWGPAGLALGALILFIIGTWAADAYGKKSGTTDDQSIVIDEVVGLWIAALPAGKYVFLWLLAFLLFRLFDIRKPWPASFFDGHSKNGFDVMMDDVVAGIYALLGVSIGALFTFT